MVVSNEPQPITRSITITEGISVKDLAEKLGIRAKDLISRLLSKASLPPSIRRWMRNWPARWPASSAPTPT
jgi:hypothetical protein